MRHGPDRIGHRSNGQGKRFIKAVLVRPAGNFRGSAGMD